MKKQGCESTFLQQARQMSETIRNDLVTAGIFAPPGDAFRMASRRIKAAIAEGAKELYLFGYGLDRLPESIGKLTDLWHLSLARNRLTELPESLGNLQRLVVLNLSNNRLRTLPKALGTLEKLQSLVLRNNGETLPENLEQLTQLHFLDLRENRLTALPESIGKLQNLQRIVLSENQLTCLPETFGELKSLSFLILRRNKLQSLPESLGRLTELRFLDLRWNSLTKLPESLCQLTRLTALDIGHNKLAALPDSFGDLTALRELNLRGNQLKTLHDCLSRFAELTALDLRNNHLTALSDSIGQLTQLTAFALSTNHLTMLPDSIGHLTKLTLLRVDDNQLTALPDSIGNLAELTALDLKGNRLSSLPESIGQLRLLRTLDLSRNQLTTLPSSLQLLPDLDELRLDGNTALNLPDDLLQSNNAQEILEYYFRRSSELKVEPVDTGTDAKAEVDNAYDQSYNGGRAKGSPGSFYDTDNLGDEVIVDTATLPQQFNSRSGKKVTRLPRVLIATALPLERDEVIKHLGASEYDPHLYVDVTRWPKKEPMFEVFVLATGPGNLEAQRATLRVLTSIKPKIGIFVGVSGGIKDSNVGDVVYSTKVYYVEGGKEEADEMKVRPAAEYTTEGLVQLAHRVAKDQWQPHDDPHSGRSPKATPAVFASSEKVLASTSAEAANYQRLKIGYNDTQVVDMESFGFLRALREFEIPHRMIIRGVSDRIEGKADSDGKGNQRIAARNATAFLFALLKRCPVLLGSKKKNRKL